MLKFSLPLVLHIYDIRRAFVSARWVGWLCGKPNVNYWYASHVCDPLALLIPGLGLLIKKKLLKEKHEKSGVSLSPQGLPMTLRVVTSRTPYPSLLIPPRDAPSPTSLPLWLFGVSVLFLNLDTLLPLPGYVLPLISVPPRFFACLLHTVKLRWWLPVPIWVLTRNYTPRSELFQCIWYMSFLSKKYMSMYRNIYEYFQTKWNKMYFLIFLVLNNNKNDALVDKEETRFI